MADHPHFCDCIDCLNGIERRRSKGVGLPRGCIKALALAFALKQMAERDRERFLEVYGFRTGGDR